MPTPLITCGACGKSYKFKPELAGRKVRCQCGEIMIMPTVAPSPKPSPSGPAPASAHAPTRAARPATAAAAPAPDPRLTSCPSCHAPVKPTAVICVACGFNLQEGTQLQTATGGVVRAATGPRGKPRQVTAPDPGGFFDKLARGWQFAKISYGILWDFKQLILFPILSTAAAILVLASFLLPLWGTGTFEQFNALLDGDRSQSVNPVLYLIAFAFYFCTYFVIVYFNTALTACAMKVTAGEAPTLGYGLAVATKRLPQIIAWAFVSALVGVVLKAIENAHEKAGRIVAAILGTGWTVLTYFVVPVLCVEGVGPFAAIKQSWGVLRQTWGEGLLGNSAMGLISFLIALPIYLILFVMVFLAFSAQNTALLAIAIVVAVLVMILHAAASSAADGVFKALLYNYATGRSMPADIDDDIFASAFASKGVGG